MKSVFLKILLLFALLCVSFFVYQGKTTSKQEKTIPQSSSITPTLTANTPTSAQSAPTEKSISVFVSYWTLDNSVAQEKADTLLYFGVAANKSGINKQDPGYTNLARFVEIAGTSKKKYLTLRMLKTESTIAILENPQLQQKIIRETIVLAQENNFDGIVLDLELTVLPFTDVKKNISQFIELFGKEVKAGDMKFAVAIYGDVFYRARPFDVKFIAQNSDEIIIMAYDFSKSYGEPGPNFPFSNKGKYGYDFQTMIQEYLKVVPADKLTVTFGMFGYDWILGEQGKPLKEATPLTVHQAKARYLNGCKFTKCQIKRDSQTKETNVTYVDVEGFTHDIWFEDEQSVEKKLEFLHQQGIGSVSYWAYGYY